MSSAMQIEPDHWRQYATPAETHANLPSQHEHEIDLDLDSIQVDIAPLEVAMEHNNWDLFMNQFGATGQVQLQ